MHGGYLPPAVAKKAVPGYVSRKAVDQRAATMQQLQYPWLEPDRFFPTIEDKRLHVKQRLVAGMRILGNHGMDLGVAGHMTARDPEFPDAFWMNPFCVRFTNLTVGTLCLMNQSGEVIYGNRPVNVAGFAIHAGIYATCPRVNAIVHTHALFGKTLSSQGRLLDPISQDSCAFYERQVLFNSYEGVVLDSDEGRAIGKALGEKNHLAVLINHGLLTVGETVDEMAWWFISAENCAQSQILAEAGGSTVKLSHAVASLTRDQVGNPVGGWTNFQPYFHDLLKREPDFLDEEVYDPEQPKFLANVPTTIGKNGKIIRNVVEERETLLARVRAAL